MSQTGSLDSSSLKDLLSKAPTRIQVFPLNEPVRPQETGIIAQAASGNERWHLSSKVSGLLGDVTGATTSFALYQVVFAPHVAIRSQPNLEADLIGLRKVGDLVEVVAKRGMWLKLQDVPDSQGRNSEYDEAWMLLEHEDHGKLLKFMHGDRNLREDLARLAGPIVEESQDAQGSRTVEGQAATKLSTKDLQLQQDSSRAIMDFVRHTYEVKHTRLYIRAKPTLGSQIVGVLRHGEIIKADGTKGPWARVQHTSTQEKEGWMLTVHDKFGSLVKLISDNSIVVPDSEDPSFDQTTAVPPKANTLLCSTLEPVFSPVSAAADWLEASAETHPFDRKRVLLEAVRTLLDSGAPFQGTAELLSVRAEPFENISIFNTALASSRHENTFDPEEVKALFIQALDPDFFAPVVSRLQLHDQRAATDLVAI
ncbi:hypothetical protein CYMTET_43736 [Cymbomonas tetramitiformis]|uniref:SH3b domain-containing protein n=1 Tax=Cymbomonas tetramitiformis TaxID=36881 RepID=A0AAE0C2W1_9CHLO|nr:hypothetical protein CYMTET_43736 [Cymbomonas tetramitiformis]